MIGILKQLDGSIVTVSCGKGNPLELLQRTHRESFPDSAILGFRDPSDLPSYRFRDCWRLSGDAIKVDMPLARAQRIKEIRAERNGRFTGLDAEWMRAMGQKRLAEADAIEAKRQVLRDIPATCLTALDACTTPGALETFQPEWPK